MSNHQDLREAAVNALTNYMHHELYDFIPANMIVFAREQANELVACADRALANTRAEGKRRGLA